MSIYKHRDDQQKYAEPGHSYAGALEASPPFLGRRLDFAAPRPRERSISHVVGCLRAVSAALICACVIARSLPNGLGDLATVLLNERPADTKGDAVGGVERGAAPFAFDSFAADRSVPRGADGLVGFRNYVLQLRFAPNPEVDDWVGNERDRGRGPELVAEASDARQTMPGSAVLPLADFLLFSEA